MSDENTGSPINLYAPGNQDQDTQTRTPADILRIAIDQWVRTHLNVWLPCQVILVRNNSFVDVQPQIQENFRVQGLVTLPILRNIPIEHPRGTNWWIKLPVQAGDYGRVSFCDRSLDNWMVNAGIVDPDDTRIHHLSDGVFTPGLYPSSSVLPGAPTDMVLHNGDAETYIQAAGTFKMLNTVTGQELFQNLVTLVSTLQTASTVDGGPFVATVVAELQQIVQNLTGLKGA